MSIANALLGWTRSAPLLATDRREDVFDAISKGAKTPQIAILGAGAAGLCMGIQLLQRGIDSFTIYEKSDGVGGTWRDNTYPGAACDVPSHLYSLSFAPKTDWSRKFPGQAEILDYFESLVGRFGLEPHLRLNTEVTDLRWDDETDQWIGSIRPSAGAAAPNTARPGPSEAAAKPGGASSVNSDTSFAAQVVVSGLGQLNQPYIPTIEGLDSFEGTTFHSARWDHDHDLRGENVAVIGIGASAIQFVPQVAKTARTMTLFQRSVNYVVPKPDRKFRPWEHWALENVPLLAHLYRESIYWRFEARFTLMRKNSRFGKFVQEKFSERVARLESPRLPREAIVPDYAPGCRRLLIANDWYPTLARPSVSVTTSPVARITADSVVTGDGVEHKVDSIIFGTGFRSTDFLTPMKVRGRQGLDLDEVWRDGAKAVLGLSVPGFPNFFMLYGPNTNLGHNSILFMIEQQVGYILKMIDAMVLDGVSVAEVTQKAMTAFDLEISEATARTVWDDDCSSWYKNDKGRITNNWPDYTVNYRRRLRRPDPRDWQLERGA